MMWVYSEDDVTVTKRYGVLPAEHWLQTTPTTGEFVPFDDPSVPGGYYEVTEIGTEQGDGWYLAPPVNTAPGVFSRTWTFDQALADQIADEDAREAEAVALRGMVTALRGVRDDPRPAQAGQRLTRLEQDVTILARALLRKLRIDQDD